MTYVFFFVPVCFQDLEDDELREGLEVFDQLILLQHLGQDTKHQSTCRAHVVRQILQKKAKNGSKRGIQEK